MVKNKSFVIIFLLVIIGFINCNNSPSNTQKTDYSITTLDTIQNYNHDSLKKYSYELIGFKILPNGTQPENGTCFFIRKKERLFLVTAKHVISGCKNGAVSPNHPDTMYVIIKDTKTEKDNWILLDLIAINKGGITCLSASEEPDVQVIEIDTKKFSSDVVINSVEDFIKERPDSAGDVEIHGFPSKSHKKNGSFFIPPPTSLYLSISDIIIADRATFTETGKVDSLNYRIIFKTLPSNTEYFGYSGSPVFFTDLKTGEKILQGIFAQTTKDLQLSLDACKIDYANKQIDSILSKNSY